MGLFATTSSLVLVMEGLNLTTTSTIAAQFCTRAERRINSILARRYDIRTAYFQTSTSVPPVLREWGDMLAEAFLWQAKARGGAGKETMARGKALYDQVMEDLEDLANYKLELLDTSGAVVPDMSDTSYRVLCNTSNYVDTIDEGDELEWRTDSDKLDDISTAKD